MKRINLGLQFFAVDGTINSTATIPNEMTTFFHRRLIMLAMPQQRYGELASKFDIPSNSGKTVDVRIPAKATAKLDNLTEGVNPTGSELTINHVTATLGIYGNVVPLTSFFQDTAYDNVFKIAFDTMSNQAGITLDTIDRNAAMTGTNVVYAPTWSGTTATDVDARYKLDSTAVFTFDLAFKASALLRANDAPDFDGYYAAVIHPLVQFDLQVNQHLSFNDTMKYTTPEKLFKGEVGELGGIRFLVSSNAKVYKGEKLAGVSSLTIKTSITTSTTTVAVKEAITAAQATALAARKVVIGTEQYTIASATAAAAGSAALTLTESIASAAADAVVYPGEAGKNNAAVFATLVCGKDAYGSSKLDGEGGEFKMIVKDAESGGTENALEMYSTVGWRAYHAAVKYVDDYMYRIETGCSIGSSITEAN